MDAMYRKSRYQEIVKKVNLFKGQNKHNVTSDKYTMLQEEVNKIIESLRNTGDQENARIHYILLTVPLVCILVWHMIKYSAYTSDTIVLILIGVAFALANHKINLVIKKSQEESPKNVAPSSNSKEFIQLKMSYLEKAMDIKRSRLLLVSLFYIIFSPILIIKLHEVALNKVPFDSSAMAYGLAYVVGGALWYFYFNRAFEVYDDIEESLSYINANL